MFDRIELLEWAIEAELPVRAGLYEADETCALAAALQRGGGHTVEGGVAAFVRALPIMTTVERELIASVTTAREAEMFVRLGADRIAVPRARSPIISPELPPIVALAWRGESPLAVTFVIVAPTVRQHLRLLSRLSLALGDARFRSAVQESGAIERVLAEAGRFDRELVSRS
jgi:hypothetical protein